MTSKCRWCDFEEESDDAMRLIDTGDCKKCGAAQQPFVLSQGTGTNALAFYFNPDHSLFIEFVKADGKTSRYTLSEDILRESGSLISSDFPMDGKRHPDKAK